MSFKIHSLTTNAELCQRICCTRTVSKFLHGKLHICYSRICIDCLLRRLHTHKNQYTDKSHVIKIEISHMCVRNTGRQFIWLFSCSFAAHLFVVVTLSCMERNMKWNWSED